MLTGKGGYLQSMQKHDFVQRPVLDKCAVTMDAVYLPRPQASLLEAQKRNAVGHAKPANGQALICSLWNLLVMSSKTSWSPWPAINCFEGIWTSL